MCGLVSNSNNFKKMRLLTSEINVYNESDQKLNSNQSVKTTSLTNEEGKLPARKSKRSNNNNSPLLSRNGINHTFISKPQFRVRNPFKLIPCQKYGNSVEVRNEKHLVTSTLNHHLFSGSIHSFS